MVISISCTLNIFLIYGHWKHTGFVGSIMLLQISLYRILHLKFTWTHFFCVLMIGFILPSLSVFMDLYVLSCFYRYHHIRYCFLNLMLIQFTFPLMISFIQPSLSIFMAYDMAYITMMKDCVYLCTVWLFSNETEPTDPRLSNQLEEIILAERKILGCWLTRRQQKQ